MSDSGKTTAGPSASEKAALSAAIDASCRIPALYLILSGVAWLVAGSLLAFLASVKLHQPEFLGACPVMSYARLAPAARLAMVYGFGSLTGLGVALWMLGRLGRTPLSLGGLATVGTVFWNLAVTVGVVAVLLGGTTGHEWLEMPAGAFGLMLASYCMVGVAAVATFASRTEKRLYVSQWYLFGALFWFPWALATAWLLVLVFPGRGVLQPIVAGWFAGNVQHLWLAPLALAALYYFVPTLGRRPLNYLNLAGPAFWVWAIFGAWTGVARYQGGPIPAWLVTVGIVATVLLTLPALLIGVNLCGWGGRPTQDGALSRVFLKISTVFFLLAMAGGAVHALRSVGVLTHFTLRDLAHPILFTDGFVGLALAGAAYRVLPALTGVRWPNRGLVSLHLALVAVGVAISCAALVLGGVHQGRLTAHSTTPYAEIVQQLLPYLKWRTLGSLLILAGNAAWAANVACLLFQWILPVRKTVISWVDEVAPARGGAA